ncbi:MAG: PAS domain S-box protein [Candidatus Lokiarchaeota archaeon]|nr:PAS domain S-box protein [Candidatus Lokiarchaeota archaeon]
MEYDKEEVRERFKELFEYSLELIYVNDLNGNFLDANDITLITLGYNLEDIATISFIDLVDQENLMKAYKFTKEIRKTGRQSQWSEYKIKTKDGDYIYIETYGIPLKKNGKIYAVLGIGKNITERKVAELKLKDSEEMFKTIYKEGPIPAYTWQKLGNDFILIDFNKAAEEISKDHVKNFIGFKASVIYEDRPDILNYLKQCIEKKERISAEIQYKFELSDEEKHMFAYYGYVNPELIVEHAEDITERKKAILSLQESEEKYREMIYNLDVGFYQVTLDGIMLNHNPAHNKILGYDPSESLIGRNVHMFWQFPEEREIYKEKLFKDGFARNYTCYALKCSGKKIVIELNSHLILDVEGNPIQIDGTFIDVTEKYNLEHNLLESEEKFRSIAEQSLLGICIIQDDLVKYINTQFADLIGYTVEEVKNWELGWFANVIHPDDRDWVIEQAKKKQLGSIDVRNYYQYRVINKSKKIIWLDNFSKTILFRGRNANLVTVVNITERKIAEQKLKESEKKYRNIYENTPFSVVLINSQGAVVDANPTTEVMFGYKRDEVIGKKFMNLSIIHPDYLPTILELFQKFVKGESMHRIDIQIQRKNGTIFWANLQAALTNIGEETYVQALFTDITSKKESELLVNKEISKLKELEKIRKNLISRVSHELKTPLVSISGGSELLLKVYYEEFSSETLEILELIEKGGKRLKHLVDRLVDISKIDYGKFELEIKSEDLSEIVRECSREISYLLRNRKINLNLSIPDSMYIKIDRIRMEQVIINLLSNAIKNSPPNGEVNVSLKKGDDWIELIVYDMGIGLTKEEMNSLFTRFGKIERFGEGFEYLDIQGSGLGLFIVKEIVNLHGGEIEALSDGRNKGAKFIVRLPINE